MENSLQQRAALSLRLKLRESVFDSKSSGRTEEAVGNLGSIRSDYVSGLLSVVLHNAPCPNVGGRVGESYNSCFASLRQVMKIIKLFFHGKILIIRSLGINAEISWSEFSRVGKALALSLFDNSKIS